jgi:AraC-like DNA-binding protein
VNNLDTVLEQFLRSGKLAQNSVRAPIAESWMRCYYHGVEPTRASSGSRRHDPARRHLHDAEFVGAGLPILEESREALSHSETVAVLADSQGIVLKTEGVADVSQFHFHRQFKKTTGLTPHQFIVQRRIERAKVLLAQSNLPIVDVAARVGFVDQSHFTTIFRKLTSMTPKIYRNTILS